jgi:FtsP/CotA-like multicopper oxidase with cupredoxin domain
MNISSLAVALALAALTAAHGSTAPPAIRANDNRVAAGQFVRHELHLSLEARWGSWYPDGDRGVAAPIQAFSEAGKRPQIPGPLIRVPLGSVVSVQIRNAIPGSHLTVHGLMDRPAIRDRSFDVPYAQTRAVRFRAGAVGTFYYWASTTGSSLTKRFGVDSQLSGAIVVDPPHALPDRIFVIGQWINIRNAHGGPNFNYELAVINGKSWPFTERLSYARGATVRWRWINTGSGGHPLHLHGFYFNVDSRGNGAEDTVYARDRDLRVTELIEPGGTFAMSWKAERAGNWLFHCHLTYHTLAHLPMAQILTGKPKITNDEYENGIVHRAGMGGLVLGISVHGNVSHVAEPPASRRLTLVVEPAQGDGPQNPAFRYVLDEGGKTISEPGDIGPPIVLTRGVPVAIDVVNHLKEATAVHWHGIELQDSYYDGVSGYSGAGARLAPMIEPGKTFEVRMAPPRAGTFIYHTHMFDVYQLRGGLAGPLIVLEPGQRFDPATDHIFTITTTHTVADAGKIFVNGMFQPPALTVHAGVRQRLRFINMTTFWTNAVVGLSSGSGTVRWQPIAVDGADLPITARAAESAVQTVTIGETRDFAFTPVARGELLVQIWPDPNYGLVTIPVHVI